MIGDLYTGLLSACFDRTDPYIYELNTQENYGISHISKHNKKHHALENKILKRSKEYYSLVLVQPKQQDDIYKDRARRFIKNLPDDIQERIIEKFGYLEDPIKIIELAHKDGYIDKQYVILFAANETVDLGEKICLLNQLFNIVKTEQDKIIERVDSLEAKVTEQSQKIDSLTAQNQELKAQNQQIIDMLKGMQSQQSFVNTQASSFVSYVTTSSPSVAR